MKKKILSALIVIILFTCSLAAAETQNDFANWSINAVNIHSKNVIDIESAKTRIYRDYLNSISSQRYELKKEKLTIGNISMKFSMKIIGDPGPNGYPVYFALRGGGNAIQELADEQYEVMKYYYQDSIRSGIYIVPYGVTASFDEHYRPESFLFYDRFIQDTIAFYNADPNRVYVLGFSSGGDGVYAIAAQTPDRYAAVNMSAGFPHTGKVGNLYNLPICLQIGEFDNAYNRNQMTARFSLWLDEAAEKYGGGFRHNTYIHVNGDHNNWSDNDNSIQRVVKEDEIAKWLSTPRLAGAVYKTTNAVEWVSQFTRDPLPQKVVWDTSVYAGLRETRAFYWLDRDGLLNDAAVIASYDSKQNSIKIDIEGDPDGTLKIYLKPEMVDVYKNVHISIGKKTVDILPIVSEQIMQKTLSDRGDMNYMFTSEIDIRFDKKHKIIEVKPVSLSKNNYEISDVSRLIYWDSDRLLFVDQSLFGLTYEQLKNKLGVNLSKPEVWQYWGRNLTWTSWDEQGICFFFQNGRTVIIYGEYPGLITDSVLSTVEKKFPEISWANRSYSCGGMCRYFLGTNNYNNTDFIQHRFEYYRLEE